MNDRALTDQQASQAIEHARVEALFAAQQQAFLQDTCPDAGTRRNHLHALKRQLLRYQDVLAEAISRDFGERAVAETKMLEVLPTTLEIRHAISHLRRWMRPSRRRPELLFATNSLQVRYQPKGVVGVIATWNFPVYLSLGPLVTALAAGNRVMIRMPETTPATNATLRKMLGEVFAEDHVALIGEELEDPAVFTALPFNHIVFTGSPAVGRIVMAQAARNLTPVTLELGGKSPAIVLRDYPVREAARSIAHGKGINCGQICVAPDYALVPREQVDAFVDALQQSFGKLFGKLTDTNADYTALATDRHAARILDLLDDARAKGATVIACGEVGSGRRMPLHIVTHCTPQMRLMREEIFGPVLPVVPYDTHEQAIEMVQQQARPLALYCFSHDKPEREKLLARTHSGGVTINDWAWHVVNHDAPFGGVGQSGMGNYHGEEGFRELSHARTVFKRHRFFPIGLFLPPYGNLAQRLTLKLFAGHGDPEVKGPF
ncbi:putative coniferyl aldehyde dehydrogenase [Cupriavidus taiwanensis]|uniref:coniferyl aldehyde dehydrogenase n=1 Tax=Cupriavidus taiwanensis TaxID=164546 RepID=UPI000E1182B8|nr:coniferyl aldehyde dehydrogenase [Cupriavidus taiwanensis]SOY94016.1 putative coniferyl aldehyde dehydrogenase [Cupriavidus taiwanensis]SOY99411.1 putative coniferyl aldehyde dehydrogenase [Cupriavidus taiwanensis]SPA30379.1 putative coniferyl aldehyde dehydrogenase [Cupriavidus taiwanensis]